MDDHSNPTAPLFVTADESTAAALRRLAGAAAVTAHHAVDTHSARRHWHDARLVVIGADLVHPCADARLPARDNVILLTGPNLPYDQAWPLALTMGASQVASLPEAAAWLTRRLSPAPPPHRRAGVVTVTGARGGVGASLLATACALTAADTGHTTLLIDADPRGGGLDVLLGWENRSGMRWSNLAGHNGPFEPDRLRSGVPRHDRFGLLSFGRDHATPVTGATAAAALDAATRGHDLVVVDAPRYGDAWLTELTTGSTLLVLVVPAEVRAVAAARAAIAAHAGHADRVRLVVTGPSPGNLSPADIGRNVGVPVAAELRLDSRLAAATESGQLASRARTGTLAATAEALLAAATPATPQPIGAQS